MCRALLCYLILGLLTIVIGSGSVNAFGLSGKSLDKAGVVKPGLNRYGIPLTRPSQVKCRIRVSGQETGRRGSQEI